jgi:hypothetical protein
MNKVKPINLTCPRCGNFIPNNDHPGEYPGALSRYSERGMIEVCSQCGEEEALIQFEAIRIGGKGVDLQAVVDPEVGIRPWTEPNPPIGI